MAGKLKCIICGTEYDTCNCARDLNSWKKICCTSNHYQVYLILNDYNFGNIKKTGARKMLSRLDIADYDNWNVASKQLVHEIIDSTPKKR